MIGARIRLASLWLSQVGRVLADWCLRVSAFLSCYDGAAPRGQAWHLATAVFIAPFVILAPLNGCLNNSLPRRWVLVGSSAFALLIVSVFAAVQGDWMICLGLVALGSAIYSPARYAMLPAVAEDAHLPLPRVNGWIEMGGASAIVGGVALGWAVHADSATPLSGHLIAVLMGLNLLSLATAFPAWFPSDVTRPERPAQAVAGFFRDCLRIGRDGTAAGILLGLACFQAIVTAGAGALLMQNAECRMQNAEQDGLSFCILHSAFCIDLLLISVAAGLGCLTAAWQGHPRRSLALVPLGATGLLLGLAASIYAHGSAVDWLPCVLLGFMGGLVNVPLRAAYQAAVPADARGNGMAVMNTAIYVVTAGLALLLIVLVPVGLLPTPAAQLGVLALLAALGAGVAWRQFFPQVVEQMLEIAMAPMYRIRVHGPGVELLPRRGPLIVLANHAAYLDPFWLCKMVPRKVTPMMTSAFFDRPVIRWSMVHIVAAIRVPDAPFRREAPELEEAAEVLRRGGCVLIFPEAQLRRRDDQPLRMFGQGVWRLLRDLPQTPVVVCWIEGGWRSFTSYFNGPPLHGKWLDCRRRIDIAIDRPLILDSALLADHHATRRHLMRTCLECRRYLDLPVLTSEDVKTTNHTNYTNKSNS